jgi:Tol biopolymer transport system component
MMKRFSFPLLFLVLFLAACTPGETEPAADGLPVTRVGVSEEAAATTTVLTALTQTAAPTSTPYETPTPTPWDVPSSTPPVTIPATEGLPPTMTPVPSFPGFRYQTAEGIWQVNENGQPELLADRMGVVLSPDGSQAVYIEDSHIWLLDNAGGQTSNLTANMNRMHCCLQWPAERPDLLLFGSWATEEFGPSSGHLSIMNSDGSGYQVLVDGESGALPAISPDGQQIAYDTSGAAWIYDLNSGTSSRLDPAEYGVENVQRIGGPSWSPDGTRIAWTIAITNPDWRIAVIIFDLVNNTAELYHTYENIGRGGWFPGPAWHPDGEWLAFVAEEVIGENFGVWAINTVNGEEVYVGWGENPIWSPDGRWLAYSGFSTGSGSETPTWLVEVGSWYHLSVQIPDNGRLLDWVSPG